MTEKSALFNEFEPWQSLAGKVVMVTGASSGLGKEFSLDLAKAGCKIVAAARRIQRLKSLCDEINKSGEIVKAVAVELDVAADSPTIEAAVNKAWNAFGRIDVLINNAGIVGPVKTPLNLSEEEWNDIFRTNLTGAWLISKYVCTKMRDAKIEGSVVNIGSISGLNRGFMPGGVAYCSSKASLNTMTKVMAMELGVHKIRVNCINPGIFRSEITEGLMEKSWLSLVTKKSVPLQTFGTSDPALLSLIRYLIHDSSSYVSGNCFIVDAGAMMELGEGSCKLRKMNLDSGPFHEFEKEISAVLEFIYQTQLELAACSDDYCLTLDQSERSYKLLGGYGAGQRVYWLETDASDCFYVVFCPDTSAVTNTSEKPRIRKTSSPECFGTTSIRVRV